MGLELLRMEYLESVAFLDLVVTSLKFRPLTGARHYAANYGGWRSRMRATFIEIGREDHKEAFRVPPVRQRNTKIADEVRLANRRVHGSYQ
jgi:hypothetical protein